MEWLSSELEQTLAPIVQAALSAFGLLRAVVVRSVLRATGRSTIAKSIA